ncbi:MAG: hypothetical protein ACD_23C00702G0001 [uncultured bacterium]|nr:MAG: hypothetical protein ACD_23C00702G0001 [uncultured bacterium]
MFSGPVLFCRSPVRWPHFYLRTCEALLSRKSVGWQVFDGEGGDLADQ